MGVPINTGGGKPSFGQQLKETMGGAVNSAVGGGITGLVGQGLGAIFGAMQDRRQLRQQQKLTDMQMDANKAMASYNKDISLDMWNKTNYGAQMEHIKAAGLNPALIYGTSGSGGSTIAGTGSGVSGGQAANAAQTEGMALQHGLMSAQIANINADTANKQATAEKTSGADTELANQQTANLITENALKEIQNKRDQIALDIENKTQDDIVKYFEIRTDTMEAELRSKLVDAGVKEKTADIEVDKAKAGLAGILLENDAKKAGINLTETQITKLNADIAQGWAHLRNEYQNMITNRKGVMSQEEKNKVMWDANKVSEENSKRMALTMLQTAGIKATSDMIKGLADLLKAGGRGRGVPPGAGMPQNPKRTQTFWPDGGYTIKDY